MGKSAPASTDSQLRLVEVLPSVVDVGVRQEATVMGVGFTEYSVLYIDDEVSVLDNIVYQGEGVLGLPFRHCRRECIIYVWKTRW